MVKGYHLPCFSCEGPCFADCNMVNFSLSPRIGRRCLQLFPSNQFLGYDGTSMPDPPWCNPGQVAGGTSPVHLAVGIIPVEQKCWVFVVAVLWHKVVPLEHRQKQWLWICWRSFYFLMYIFHSGSLFTSFRSFYTNTSTVKYCCQ